MRQFDVLSNTDAGDSQWAPYLVVVQSDLLEDLQSVVVAPLVPASQFGQPVTILHPVFEVAGETLVLSVSELAGVSRSLLGEPVGSLASQRDAIIAAVDLLFTGV